MEAKCGTQEACQDCSLKEYDPLRAQRLGGVAWAVAKTLDLGVRLNLEEIQKMTEILEVITTPVEVIDINDAVDRYKNGDCNLERIKLYGKDF